MRIRMGLVLIGGLSVHAASGQEVGPPLGRLANAFVRRQAGRAVRALNRPIEPFRIIGNLYYVGAEHVSSFLITTPQGHILIDSGFEETAPLIRDAVRKLGFRLEDVKVLLNSHAHLDHAGGHALLKELSGAQIVMSEADSKLLARGGRGDVLPLGDELATYPPARADRLIRDRDRVTLGGVTLTAHLTPGHTMGCTTWTMGVEEDGKHYDVVFLGSTTILPGVRLVGNPKYPEIAEDFARTFGVLKSLPCDIFLAPHGVMFGLEPKAKARAEGALPNPFIDSEGYRAFLARGERIYLDQLRRERGEAPSVAHDRHGEGREVDRSGADERPGL